ncbi:hypothetical protein G6F57_004216 [Rhizopus arrhizus]|uniref:Uncharacterized protein n=1 Tax=Rhizopus oryzae TaxID=64495 RepID=A0A9P6XCB6_RHIOR|nr:hypothetical protein G6F23_006668 [Rhizopus arrhizus]KAG1427191.1 hypothetical protein G6F58_001133 [Rhizopus delemar]KAG0766129.1 hypothetical protein G6F24_003856 [Rhizopus arrhizus]KAG0793572.1 hypothetical protein G6F21_003514 [Rhizopus arrhizus]KAG0801803.1 hypothetical protein G6F22_000886 [Rhizopus arrhizus]
MHLSFISLGLLTTFAFVFSLPAVSNSNLKSLQLTKKSLPDSHLHQNNAQTISYNSESLVTRNLLGKGGLLGENGFINNLLGDGLLDEDGLLDRLLSDDGLLDRLLELLLSDEGLLNRLLDRLFDDDGILDLLLDRLLDIGL